MSAGWRLAAALLALLLPAAGQAAAGDERLSLASRDHALNQNGAATELRAILRKPDGPGPFPALVLLHGCGGLLTRSGKIDARFDEWASRFRDLGYLSLLLDSFNPRGEREICTKAKRPILPSRERPLDAYAALLFLQARADVQADRIGLIGWSNGAQTVLWTIAERSSARPPGLSHDFKAAAALYPGCRDVLKSARWRAAMPLLVLIGSADDWTAAEPCTELVAKEQAAGGAAEIRVYPGAHHGFDAPNQPLRLRTGLAMPGGRDSAHIGTDPAARADAIDRIPAFFAKYLR